MTFKKPNNISYTEMAIYVDQHIYDKDCDDSLCYEYLYHLFNMLAYKKRFFKTPKEYDEYAIFAASHLYKRYRNDKLPHIDSCLNYIKKILYPLKVDYQQQNYSERFQPESITSEGTGGLKAELESRALDTTRELVQLDVSHYLQNISNTIKGFLKLLPYSNDKVITKNIYLSCMLSLLKQITLSNENKQRLENSVENRPRCTSYLVEDIYRKESQEEVVLFHLDDSMLNYVKVILSKIKRKISKDIIYLAGYYQPSATLIRDILTSPMQNSTGEERWYIEN